MLTLAVEDLAQARAFYVEHLGWPEQVGRNPELCLLPLPAGMLLVLASRSALRAYVPAHIGLEPTPNSNILLAHNVASPAAVDVLLARAQTAGAPWVQAGQRLAWGGYGGWFTDKDGHLWEVVYNPDWPVPEPACQAAPS